MGILKNSEFGRSICLLVLLSFFAFNNPALSNCKDIVVAVVDTGLDTNSNVILQNKTGLFTNLIEKNGKAGVDDDNNGYIDDVHGWNFKTNTANFADKNGHGTHISNIILENSKSLSASCNKIKILPLKFLDADGSDQDTLRTYLQAIRYAVKMNADIINYSGGGDIYNTFENEIFSEAEKKGILLVTASGNLSRNIDQRGFYPASYSLKNIISVANLTAAGSLHHTSNWGANSVDIAAPGDRIIASSIAARKIELTGTSQSAAFVSALAAELKRKNMKLSSQKIKEIILSSSKKVAKLSTKLKSSGTLNRAAALQKVKAVHIQTKRFSRSKKNRS